MYCLREKKLNTISNIEYCQLTVTCAHFSLYHLFYHHYIAPQVLITTNVLARGVDVPAVAVVVNYDLPVQRIGTNISADEATYLHRIGRCGRFGRRGTAINFLETPQDFNLMIDIEKHYSPERRMTTEWDPTDIEGLSDAIKSRPEGGEIAPAAHGGSNNPVNVSIFV